VVVAQEPPPSTEAHSPAMNFLVSLGPPAPAFACPDFVGKPLEEARRIIQAAGFTVGETTQVPSAAGVGTVVGQTPAPGSKIGQDATFVFQVAGPPETPTSPPNAVPAETPHPGQKD